jgi:hypothetical protein
VAPLGTDALIHDSRFLFLLPSFDAHFYYHGNRGYLQYFIKVHTFIIHGNRSASPWSSKFQKNWRKNPCSPLPAPRSRTSFSHCSSTGTGGGGRESWKQLQSRPFKDEIKTHNLIPIFKHPFKRCSSRN